MPLCTERLRDQTRGHPKPLLYQLCMFTFVQVRIFSGIYRDRVCPKKPFIPNTAGDPNYSTGYSELKGILGITHTGSESGSDISMLAAVEKVPKEFERKNTALYDDKSNYGSMQSVPRTSWDYNSYQGTVQEYASSGASESSSTKIKILCSFAGRILPRPSDGKLRYVGGETRIISIRKDITWQELWQKAIAVYNQTRTIKYQLPEEDLDALVSVSCDEDLQNMMEECNVQQDGEGPKRLRMFLFSLSDLEDAHFDLGNSDGDSEIQYVVAVNGIDVGSRKNSTLHGLASSSGNNLDELDGENFERDTGGAATDFVEDGTRNIGLPPLDPSLGDFDISSLQIIHNEDLEELRELGSGTFGTVYHGKWRGTDVAIKRIKKSCFTGRLSEQERLVGDFGLSKIKRNTLVSGGVRGTLPWMAPELLNGSSNKVSEKVDVFSFGIVLWEILTGERGIVNNTLRPSIPSFCDPEWKRLMEECWAPNPVVRPPFTEIASKLRVMSQTKVQANKTSK
ncbi:Dual specificity protein kinase shkA [Camellia lanceoleosa]|uniref:Dual specificity protein kinase shkA n=1 Tax=Camellia lanceoleosa TaxID=1840588 RepID=A0ACC0GXH8_9ERIC|nr:Dual specificity protein kinase shkA [Camellia lanceoleosa]